MTRSSVAPPAPPQPYGFPSGATVVSSADGLAAALAGAPKDIVLADGTYRSSTYFQDSNGSRLYAQHPGGAVLTSALVVGGNFSSGGAIVRGIAFDIASPGNTFQGGALQTWGPAGANLQVLDCTFEGHGNVPVGLLAYNPTGLTAQRLSFSHFTDEAIRASDNILASYGSPTPAMSVISDISVDGVSRSVPGSSDGTAEAGIFIGNPVTNGVHRIRIRNVSISGIETANNAWDTTFSDLDIDMSGPNATVGVGVYLEHFSRRLSFSNFAISGARVGFNGEWNDGTAGNAAAHDVSIANGTIAAQGWPKPGRTAGIYLDEGSDSTTITNVLFLNQNWAGIGVYKNVGSNNIGGNSYQLLSGAAQISTDHI